MMTIEIWLGIALIISLVFNAILYSFSKEQNRRLLIVSENIGDLVGLITNFRQHLKAVYQLESFYGDETLSFLLDHTRELSNLLGEQYGDVTSITEQIEYQIEEEEESEEENKKEQDVFYGGTRTGNT